MSNPVSGPGPAQPRAVRWELTRHPSSLGMAQLPAETKVPAWALNGELVAFTSVQRTADELTVICGWTDIPGGVVAVGPFTAFSIDGPLDHSLIGVLSGLLAPLARADISILAESTYNTDWVLVPTDQAAEAVRVWTAGGHTISQLPVTDQGVTDGGATDRGATDRGATDRGATDRGATDGAVTDGTVTDGAVTDGGAR